MADVAFTQYRGFLIVEYSETDVKAYRDRDYYARDIASYKSASQADISRLIDSAGDYGGFTDAEYYELMRILGRAEYVPTQAQAQPVEPEYPTHIMDRVRQHIGLEPGDTSRDAEINAMSHDLILDHCLEWEGIIGYGHQMRSWIEDIYGVNLSTFGV